MEDYKEQYLAALRRVSELENEVASLNGALAAAQTALAANREDLEQASAIRKAEIDALRDDLNEAQQKLLTAAVSGASQSTVDALKAELVAYKTDNAAFVEALQEAADCNKSKAQQIAANALGQPTG